MKMIRPLLHLSLIVLLLAESVSGARATVADILLAQGFHRGTVLRETGGDADFIQVEINGHPFTLLIDTGSYYTSLRLSAAKKAHLPLVSTDGTIAGLQGPLEHNELVQVSSFTINGQDFTPGPVYAAAFGDPGRFGSFHFDGVIGLMSMRLNHVFFGYVPGEFFFQPKDSGTGDLNSFLLAHGFARINLDFSERFYFLSVSFDGTPAKMFLDSGNANTLLSFAFGEKAKLPAVREFMQTTGSAGQNVLTIPVLPQHIEIGSLLLPRIPVTAGNIEFLRDRHSKDVFADGSLGFDLVGRLFPFLDTGHDWLYVTGFRPLPDKKDGPRG